MKLHQIFAAKAQKGVTMIEYALIAALIAIVAITALTSVGQSLLAKFTAIATSPNAPIAMIVDEARKFYATQFHLEVIHTPHGAAILQPQRAAVGIDVPDRAHHPADDDGDVHGAAAARGRAQLRQQGVVRRIG